MKVIKADSNRVFFWAAQFFLIFAFGVGPELFAHGGEDHGDEKPKTAATGQGAVLHTTRLGALEIALKHPVFAPDTATEARLFITDFETNEPDRKASPAIEIEAANGAVTTAAVEKSETAGVYTVKFPALPQGVYTIRAKITYDGETDTATFSGVEAAPAAAETDAANPAQTLLTAFIFLLAAGLFGGLIYFVLRFNKGETINKKAVSA